jgi:predicted DNA-binding protein (UPF0251 family)
LLHDRQRQAVGHQSAWAAEQPVHHGVAMDDAEALRLLADYIDMMLRELDALVQYGIAQGTHQAAIALIAEKISEKAAELELDLGRPPQCS